MNDTPSPPTDTTEAQDVLLAVLVDRLGGTVTITERELHAMRNSPRQFTAVRGYRPVNESVDPRLGEVAVTFESEWTLTLLPDATDALQAAVDAAVESIGD